MTHTQSTKVRSPLFTLTIMACISAVLFGAFLIGAMQGENDRKQVRADKISAAEKLIQSQDPNAKLLKDTVEFQGKSATAKVVFGSTYKTCVFPELKSVVCNAA